MELLIEAWASLNEFSAQGPEQSHSAGLSWQSGGELPWGEALESDARVHHRCRCEASPERKRQRSQAELPGKPAGREPPMCCINTELFEANGRAERDAALIMLEQIPGTQRVTVAGDKGYDTKDFVAECRNMNVTPHVAQNDKRSGGERD